ncbi:hypothetical protein TVAGG3_0335640 [Trichomonas vaginalis G3]|uniref:hypothetical protein n=1 Tax=Trichomonas vaginalis (strain ATCC PRA-98 / G3) TaxID=412133 RepID=UPI0021E5DDF1|nr:hypothetical protein TVAGG3_0335640 [Trichomonas vaginalis G3]KAI5530254.1 hypothetical protein TVAGG3_0335640 [Trichomonas vaginalis G3]
MQIARGDNRKYLKDEDLDFLDNKKVKVIYVSPKKQEEKQRIFFQSSRKEPSYEEEDIQEPSQSKSSTLDTEHKEIYAAKISIFTERFLKPARFKNSEVFRRLRTT